MTAIFSISEDKLVQVDPWSEVFHTPPPTLPAIQVFPLASAASIRIALVLPATFRGPRSVNVAAAAAEVP